MKKWVARLLGWLFIVLGILGLFLPVLQGILFLVIGLVILSSEYAWAHHLLNKLAKRFPAVARRVDVARCKANALLRRCEESQRTR